MANDHDLMPQHTYDQRATTNRTRHTPQKKENRFSRHTFASAGSAPPQRSFLRHLAVGQMRAWDQPPRLTICGFQGSRSLVTLNGSTFTQANICGSIIRKQPRTRQQQGEPVVVAMMVVAGDDSSPLECCSRRLRATRGCIRSAAQPSACCPSCCPESCPGCCPPASSFGDSAPVSGAAGSPRLAATVRGRARS